jgi:hypothetical protein
LGNPEAVEEMHLNGSETVDLAEGGDMGRNADVWVSEVEEDTAERGGCGRVGPTVEYPASFTELILEDVNIMYGRLVQLLNGAKWLRCLHVSIGSYGLVDEEQLKEVLASCAVECLHYEVRKSAVDDGIRFRTLEKNADGGFGVCTWKGI